MICLSTSGSISLGCALVAGKKRVPRPAAGMTALRTAERVVTGSSLARRVGPDRRRAEVAAHVPDRRRPPYTGSLRSRLLTVDPAQRGPMPTYEYRCKNCGH